MKSPVNIDYTVQIWREGTQFVAHAMPIDVMSSGNTVDQARHAVDEAVTLFLDTAKAIHTLESVLEECGYCFDNGKWVSPAWVGMEHRSIQVGV